MKFIVCFSFLFCLLNLFNLQALDNDDIKNFANEYFRNKECQKYGWSEFVFAVDKDYDEVALFYAVDKPSLVYLSNIEESKLIDIHQNKWLPKKFHYKNIINTLVRKNKAVLLKQLLELYPQEINAFDYTMYDKQNYMFEKEYALPLALRMHENLDVAKVLVDGGIEVNLIEEEQRSIDGQKIGILKIDPLSDAILYYKGNNMEAVSLLLNYGAKPTTWHVYLALARELNEIADLLIDVMINNHEQF